MTWRASKIVGTDSHSEKYIVYTESETERSTVAHRIGHFIHEKYNTIRFIASKSQRKLGGESFLETVSLCRARKKRHGHGY